MLREVNISQDRVPDSLIVCPRDHFAFITFADSGTTLGISEKPVTYGFPYLFIESARQLKEEHYFNLKQQLKYGKDFEANSIYSDWVLIIILISAFLFSLIRSTSKSFIQNIFKSVTLLGFRTEISRDIGGLFHWQSTLVNLVSFLNIGLFIYFIQKYYNLIQVSFPQIFLWFSFFILVIIAITLRHFICIIIGNASEEREALKEYLYGIYQMYRVLGLIFFIFIVLISYTSFVSAEVYFIAGFILMSVLYFFRIIRLLKIFINRHMSIFYYILYLCALEILPAVVLIKFLTGSN
jgi:hypothetical protein